MKKCEPRLYNHVCSLQFFKRSASNVLCVSKQRWGAARCLSGRQHTRQFERNCENWIDLSNTRLFKQEGTSENRRKFKVTWKTANKVRAEYFRVLWRPSVDMLIETLHQVSETCSNIIIFWKMCRRETSTLMQETCFRFSEWVMVRHQTNLLYHEPRLHRHRGKLSSFVAVVHTKG